METEYLRYQMKKRRIGSNSFVSVFFCYYFVALLGNLLADSFRAVAKSADMPFRHSSGYDLVMGFCLILWHAFFLVEEFLGVHRPALLLCDFQRTSSVKAQAILILFRMPVLWEYSPGRAPSAWLGRDLAGHHHLFSYSHVLKAGPPLKGVGLHIETQYTALS